MQSKNGSEEKFSNIADPQRRTLAAMQNSLDEGIGAIVQSLKQTGQWENTIIWFLNDNGAGTYWKFDNAGLRNFKGSLFDGGIKVASFVHFPSSIKMPTHITKPTTALDVLPTVLSASKITIPVIAEGIDLTSAQAIKQLSARTLHWRQGQIGAIRDNEWKLILINNKPTLLFHLETDPNEHTNVIDQNKEITERLRKSYVAWDKNNVEPLWGPSQQAGGIKRYSPDAPWENKAKVRGLKKPEKITILPHDAE